MQDQKTRINESRGKCQQRDAEATDSLHSWGNAFFSPDATKSYKFPFRFPFSISEKGNNSEIVFEIFL